VADPVSDRLRLVALLALLTSAAACGSGSTDAIQPDAGDAGISPGSCPGIAGRRFGSLTPMECGTNMGSIVYCTWTIDFDTQGRYFWMRSDAPWSGTYRCEGSQILDTRFPPPTVAGQYDQQNDRLTWYDAAYAPSPP
jgi:hypothetical protein